MLDNVTSLEKLFEVWKEDWKRRDNTTKFEVSKFVRDGIIDPSTWEETYPKILVILKEPNNEQGDKTIYEDYDLCSTLRQDKEVKAEFATWRNIFLWSYGIMNTTVNNRPSCEEAEKNLAIRNIAVMNLKKSYGSSESDMSEIKEFADCDKIFIAKEIELINPDVIITANVMDLIEPIMSDRLKKNISIPDFKYNDWINVWNKEDKSVCIIRHYHPQYTGNKYTGSFTDEIKYNICCDSYYQYLTNLKKA